MMLSKVCRNAAVNVPVRCLGQAAPKQRDDGQNAPEYQAHVVPKLHTTNNTAELEKKLPQVGSVFFSLK